MKDSRNAYRVFVGKSEEKSQLKRTRLRWVNDITWIFKEWNGAWTELIWLRTGTGGVLL